MKRLITLGLVATVVVSAVVIITQNAKKQTAVPPTAVPTQRAPVPTTTTPGNGPGQSDPKLNPSLADAVAAAALANASLSAAQLMPARQMRQVVQKQIVPANRQAAAKTFAVTGKILAQWWGYQSVSEARVRASYYVVTQMYKVMSVKGNSAQIALYNFTHFRTVRDWDYDQEHWDAAITIIDMRRQDGRWLYVKASDPAAGDMPSAQVGLSFEQTKARLQPYLRGFTNYASAS